jgi:hypothetical protein
VNGLSLLVLIALAIGVFVAYRMGKLHGRRDAAAELPLRAAVTSAPPAIPAPDIQPRAPALVDDATEADRVGAEKARLTRSLTLENDALRRAATTDAALRGQLADFAEDRRRLLRDYAIARGDTARYRELVVDLENNALPPLLDGPNMFDDL